MSEAHVRAFVRESEEGITELNNSLLALESDPDDAAAMDAIFRTAHTLKGNAAAMGFSAFSGLAHAMEDLLDEVRDGDIDVSPDLMDLLFEGVDLLDAMLGDIDETGDTGIDPSDTAEALRTLAEEGDAAALGDDGDGDGSDDASAGDATAGDDDGDADDADGDGPAGTGARTPDFEHGLDPADDEGVYRAAVTLAETEMPGVDAMFLLQAVEESFGDLATDPDRESVEDGAGADGFDCYLTAGGADEVDAGLSAVSKVGAVDVSVVEPAPGEDADPDDGATDAAGGDDAAADAEDDVGGAVPDDDVQLVATRANVSEEDAREALEAEDGDLAAAISRLE
jgi:two-component system chemotaxis sensor kinase CheA